MSDYKIVECALCEQKRPCTKEKDQLWTCDSCKTKYPMEKEEINASNH
jgi:ribosomal protein L37AE/L43A